jgi:lipopolysaccharide/colanic/teichoic acid biosynthesis glycosyltransferase
MHSILYIGSNGSFIQDYGLDSKYVSKIEHKANGFLAYDFLQHTKEIPQIVLCDNTISGMYSFQLFKNLRLDKKFDKVTFVLLTDREITKKEAVVYLKSGIDEAIEKPFKLDNFTTRLSFLVNYRKLSKKQRISSSLKRSYKFSLIKRSFDILIAITALICISPVLLFTIIAIKIESKGPLFYSSKRVGSGYQIFDFYKFRSMHIDAEERLNEIKSLNQYAVNTKKPLSSDCVDCLSSEQNCSPMLFKDGKEICEKHYLRSKKYEEEGGTFIKISDDPRVTAVGKFIRNTSIDELPQLINVIKGDMSIVGNRPLPLYEAELLTSDNWAERFLAPAGITGLWQVEKRGAKEMSEEERKRLDNKYAQNCTFFNDIKLIVKTVPALFQADNV